MLGSGQQQFAGIPAACSSDTSQVDNFIFQHNLNRFSNEVSQDFDSTPYREGHLHRNTTNKNLAGWRIQGINSRNASSPAARQDSGHTASYQGACRILNFQQPLFQGLQSNSGFDEQSARDDDT